MKPLAIVALIFAVLPQVAPLSAKTSEPTELGNGNGFKEIMTDISAAKKKSGESKKGVNITEFAAKNSDPSKPGVFDRASKEFKNEPGRMITVASNDIESILGRWAISAYADSLRESVPRPSWVKPQNTLEFSHEGFRFTGDQSWRPYDAGIDAEMHLIGKNILPDVEDFHVTICNKPDAKDMMICQTGFTHTRFRAGSRYELEHTAVVSYAQYTRVKE